MANWKPRKPSKPPDSVLARSEFTGRFNHVTFANDENTFSVVRFVSDDGVEMKASGNLFGASKGETLRIRGQWKEHPKHGWTFSLESYQPIETAGEDSVLAYLGSGMIKGVREKTAEKIVKYFGDRTMEVLDESPEQLREVPGISPKLADRIARQWAEHQRDRETMLFLKGNGLSNALAVRLMKHYGDRVVAVIRANPYQAGLDVPRVGFMKADEIASKLGVAKDSPQRIMAAFVHLLDQASAEGHTFLPREDLLERTTELLDVDFAKIEEQLAVAVEQKYIRQDVVGDRSECYFMPSLHLCESGLVRLLLELVRQGKPIIPGSVESCIDDFETKFRFQLAPQQKDALRSAIAGGVCVITGGPGTGKTTLVRALLHLVKQSKARVALCSPTGRAAQRLSESARQEATTVHRLLKWNAQTGRFTHNRESPLEADLLIVDEAEMLDVGDVDQLPSVGPGTFLRDLITSGRIRTTRLNVIFRQAEKSLIIRNSHRINEGHALKFDNDADSDFFFIDRDEKTDVQDAIIKMATERIPQKLNCDPVEDVQVLSPMRRGELGVQELNLILQEKLNPRGEVVVPGFPFRRGDKVIQNSNNYDLNVYNGDVGRILGVHPETRQIQIRFGRQVVFYDAGNLEELDLAYAITIHKSQGSEYPAVIVVMHTTHYIMLKRNLVYTGVTRGKKLVVIVGNRRGVMTAIRSSSESERMTALGHWLTRPPEKNDLFG